MEKVISIMWLYRGNKSKEEEIRAIHKSTFDRIDKATESIDRNSQALEKLNKALVERGDVAYNIFVATGGLRRHKGNKK